MALLIMSFKIDQPLDYSSMAQGLLLAQSGPLKWAASMPNWDLQMGYKALLSVIANYKIKRHLSCFFNRQDLVRFN